MGRWSGTFFLGVVPEYQRRGIGAKLIDEGLKRCRGLGIDYVIVLGHPGYYPKYGFRPIRTFGLSSAYGDGEAVMLLELTAGVLSGLEGTIRYAPEFAESGC